MLKLENITKEYPLEGSNAVKALKGISLEFRDNEFVSILGHSGCGKTTLLNIIGGLDRYTEGEMFINGVSTKQYKDKDWDTYRNHRVGFVFQTYNLIMHLSVIENVELALTLVGIDRKTRRERACAALEAVGLAGQEYKKPNQLSGGQMQRVAIARALINNPNILLADEPTGALDSETSVQIMDILKSLSSERLVVMVTHNPDLAYEYSTRIVRLTDGVVVDDSNPYQATEEEIAAAVAKQESEENPAKEGRKKGSKGKNKTSMSYKSALRLSGKNLWLKRTRTALTSVAGSIGIIGIAIVLALSSGFASYVSATAENALSQYPLTITGSDMSMTSVVNVFMKAVMSHDEYEKYPENDEIGLNNILGNLLKNINSILHKNDLKTLKVFLDDRFNEDWGTVKYDYNVTMHIYTNFAAEPGSTLQYYKINPFTARVYDQLEGVINYAGGGLLGDKLEGLDVEKMLNSLDEYSTMFNVWDELTTNDELLHSQYELIGGEWPTDKSELVVVVDKYNHIDDYILFALGLCNPNDAGGVVLGGITGNSPLDDWTYSAQELIDTVNYRLLLESSYYSFNAETGEWKFVPYLNLADDSTGAIRSLVEPTEAEEGAEGDEEDKALSLRVSGVVRLREGVGAGSINGAIAYTHELVEWMMEKSKQSEIVQAQRAIKIVKQGRSKAEGKTSTVVPDEVEYCMSGPSLDNPLEGRTTLGRYTHYYVGEGETDVAYHSDPQWEYAEGCEEQVRFLEQAGTGIVVTSEYYRETSGKYYYGTAGTPAHYSKKYYKLTGSISDDAYYGYKSVVGTWVGEVTEAQYNDWLHKLGYAEFDSPAAISIYASSFNSKDKILALLNTFGADKDLDGDGVADGVDLDGDGKADGSELQYNDTVGTLMSGITLIIKAITYVLIAFSSISLVVSSIMIAIITYTSVMERTKEIGILRSIGARKKDITRVFNSETFIIGTISGIIAVLFTWLMSFPVNAILKSYTGISNLVVIAWWHPLLLVGLSVFLTVIAGFIPSRMAAAKDPVLALRTE